MYDMYDTSIVEAQHRSNLMFLQKRAPQNFMKQSSPALLRESPSEVINFYISKWIF